MFSIFKHNKIVNSVRLKFKFKKTFQHPLSDCIIAVGFIFYIKVIHNIVNEPVIIPD